MQDRLIAERSAGVALAHPSLRQTHENSRHLVPVHTCPNKIFSGLIQPIPHAFSMEEEGKPARSSNYR